MPHIPPRRGYVRIGLIRPNAAAFGSTNGPTVEPARERQTVDAADTIVNAIADIAAAARRIVKSRRVWRSRAVARYRVS
jgi:hypothetical protein